MCTSIGNAHGRRKRNVPPPSPQAVTVLAVSLEHVNVIGLFIVQVRCYVVELVVGLRFFDTH